MPSNRTQTAAVPGIGSAQHVFLASIATSVGLDPQRDIEWVTRPPEEAKRLLAEGKIDAFLGFPPDPQELRSQGIGRVVLNSAKDRPWSQYFCCMVAANREFTRKNPVATKRALRAIVKASELCASDPDRGAKAYLGQGFTASKVRWSRPGMGKQGGARVIYFTRLSAGELWMLLAYPKSAKGNIPGNVLNQIRMELEDGHA